MELGWFVLPDTRTVALALVAFAFPLQLLASIFGFLGRDSVAATGFGVQGASWLIIGLDHLISPPGHTDPALGVVLLAASSAILICTAGSALGKLAPAFVLGLTGIRLLLTGVHELTDAALVGHIAAVPGLVQCPAPATWPWRLS
jgi:hypothetical protein